MDLDQMDQRVTGTVSLFPYDRTLLASCSTLDIPDIFEEINVNLSIGHFVSETGYVPTWPEMRHSHPDTDFPTSGSAKITPKDGSTLLLEWNTPVGTFGSVKVKRANCGSRSRLVGEQNVKSWREFQDRVTGEARNRIIYRGQGQPWPLRTGFHRTNRRDLRRFVLNDIPELHNALSARLNHFFRLDDAGEYGAFMNLAQHHGYPTPLLDWTKSPFVAAYFAYRAAAKEGASHVRVYAFDRGLYEANVPQFRNLMMLQPHFSIVDALPIENERAVPQQGVLALTNLEDVEWHISKEEARIGKRFLTAYDLPTTEAPKALRDLRLMGITDSTMFPSVETTCAEQKSRNF
jgi:hypothetical protein